MSKLADAIVFNILEELSRSEGCDIEEIVNDDYIYEGMLLDLADRVDNVLKLKKTKRVAPHINQKGLYR